LGLCSKPEYVLSFPDDRMISPCYKRIGYQTVQESCPNPMYHKVPLVEPLCQADYLLRCGSNRQHHEGIGIKIIARAIAVAAEGWEQYIAHHEHRKDHVIKLIGTCPHLSA